MGYDQWLEKPYQDDCDNIVAHSFVCADVNELSEDEENEDGLPYCDFAGDVDAYVETASGKGWWEITYTAQCPKCERKLVDGESDSQDDY